MYSVACEKGYTVFLKSNILNLSTFFGENRAMYSFVLYVHLVSAVLSIGPFFVLFPILSRMKTADPALLRYDIHTFRFVVRLSKHMGHILVVSGIILIYLGNWSWFTPWIVATILILISALFFIARAFSPILRKLELPESNRIILINKLQRALIAYIVILCVMMWFMVAKPNLWLSLL